MDQTFSDEIKDIIALSKEEALRLGHDYIGTEHLLLGVIRHKSSNIYKEFFDSQHLKKIVNTLETINPKKDASEKEFSSEHNRDRVNLHLTSQAERALKTTFLEAKLSNDFVINTFHLFLCVMRNENDPVTIFFNTELGIDYDLVKEIYRTEYIVKSDNAETFRKRNPFTLNKSTDSRIFFANIGDEEFKILDPKNQKERINFLNILKADKNTLEKLKLQSVSKEELAIINEFKQLKILKISNSSLESLGFLKKMSSIENLSLINCEIESIQELPVLKNLRFLILSQNNISDIKRIKSFPKLEVLDISYNQVTEIESIKSKILNNLLLFFDYNRLNAVSKDILLKILKSETLFFQPLIIHLKNILVQRQKYELAARLRDLEKKVENKTRSEYIDILSEDDIEWLRELYYKNSFKNNPIESPPIQIILEGEQHIKDYFNQSKKDNSQKYLYEGKLLVIGEGGTGKTSFTRKIEDIRASLPDEDETTFNIDVKQIALDIKDRLSSKMFINIWDFGGQKIYRGTHQLFFSDKCLYVLVDDNREEKTDFSYWLNTVEQLAGKESKLIIVINQKHGRKNISFDEIGYKKQFSSINFDVIPIDLLKDEDSLEILKELIKVRFSQLPQIGNSLPTSWVDIREQLSTISDNFISYDRFARICKSNSIQDESSINTLCSYFDNIGVFTHYSDDPILKERIYLNSNWLVETVYEVLDNEIIEKNKGIISKQEVNEIWNNKNLDFEFDRLCSLMNKFGLMYYIKESDKFVVPEKLPKQMPYEIWTYNDSHLLKFKYEFGKYNPKGLMSKLIVYLSKYIQNHDNVWHRGLNIEYQNTYAEIIETYSINNTFEIKISGENKTGLLALIIDKFDEILEPYENLDYEKYVQCICENCISDNIPHFFKYSDLLKRREKNVLEIDCEKDYNKVSVSCLLEGIELNKSNMKKIKVFLASSSELIRERDEIELFINRENKKLIESGQFIHLERWEDFNDSMSKTRLQNEYNEAAMSSDVFISLFSTKVGKFTEEEFDRVHSSFTSNNKPKYIYTFFKNEKKGMNEINRDDFASLIKFQDKLQELGHYQTNFEDFNDLIKQIKLQLDRILPEI
ncbi:COR domain-containing protein [Winogradskyella flava]|uniref:COR domain-containing protein n=1 Tax=Winogradskyella flava TaxID=1884876 RepID=UPI0024905B7E|nr:COR domain-containing protein [Winogradskyella flava]